MNLVCVIIFTLNMIRKVQFLLSKKKRSAAGMLILHVNIPITFQLPNLNAHLIQNVPSILHASKKNVKILVSQQNVVLMLIAKSIITEHSVFVELDMLEILTISVKNVSYFLN